MLERVIVRAYRWLRWQLAHRRGERETPEYEALYLPQPRGEHWS